jgi:hypothetical protein
MDTIYLVACVSKKRQTAKPARELYCSPWFNAAKRYVGERKWFILSAAHYVLSPDTIIAPYNITLNGMSKRSRDAWGKEAARHLPKDAHCIFLAGQKYWEPIAPFLASYETPLKGLGIGQQLAWFKAREGLGNA